MQIYIFNLYYIIGNLFLTLNIVTLKYIYLYIYSNRQYKLPNAINRYLPKSQLQIIYVPEISILIQSHLKSKYFFNSIIFHHQSSTYGANFMIKKNRIKKNILLLDEIELKSLDISGTRQMINCRERVK